MKNEDSQDVPQCGETHEKNQHHRGIVCRHSINGNGNGHGEKNQGE